MPASPPLPQQPTLTLRRRLHRRLAPVLGPLRRRWVEHGPERLAALLAALAGILLLQPKLAGIGDSLRLLDSPGAALRLADIMVLPRVLLGSALVLAGGGLLVRARIAWVLALLLGLLGAGVSLKVHHHSASGFGASALLVLVLVAHTRRFHRSSIAAGSLFALLGVVGLLGYGMLGSLWFGDGYAPPIQGLGTALYYTVETMSTVGYGDIVPRSMDARMFTVSLIVLGITVFATTLSVVIGPLVGDRIRRTLEGRMQQHQRRDHYVIVGVSALAFAAWQSLQQRGVAVTVVASQGAALPYPATADIVLGDAASDDVLRQAGVAHARAVLTLREDDAENAFVVLAVKELAPGVKTIAGVNDARHLTKIQRVQPDLLFAPQVLGSDLLARTLLDEAIDNRTVADLLFARGAP